MNQVRIEEGIDIVIRKIIVAVYFRFMVSSCEVAREIAWSFGGVSDMIITPLSSSNTVTSSRLGLVSKTADESKSGCSSAAEAGGDVMRCAGSSIMARALRVVSVADGLNRRRVGVGGTEMTRSDSSSVGTDSDSLEPPRSSCTDREGSFAPRFEPRLNPSSVSDKDSIPGSSSSSLQDMG
jgi:hypothetical protein